MHKATQVWISLTSGLWFFPSLLVLASIGFALGLVEVDRRFAPDLAKEMPQLFAASPEGSRTMLSTIAGSMITVAGVTFSITIVSLSLASTQFSPRILRNFTSDRANQLVLGTFVGIFAYCLVVLRTVRGGDVEFVPSLSVFGGFLLALLGVGVLIFFIDHVAYSIQASTILERIERETVASVQRLFPEELGEEEAEARGEHGSDRAWAALAARRPGYLQDVDEDGLLSFARRREVVVRMDKGIGEFVLEGDTLASIAGLGAGDDAAADELHAMFSIGSLRTIEQDVGFGLRQIDDVALRALSPGVNDTTTAMSCIDRVSSILGRLASRRFPSPERYDGPDLRVIARRRCFRSLLERTIDPVRRAAEGNVAVLGRLTDALAGIGVRAGNASRRRAIEAQLELLAEAIDRTVAAPHDREKLQRDRELALERLRR